MFFGKKEVTGAEYVEFLNDPNIRSRIDRRTTTGLLYAPRAAIADDEGVWQREGG